MTPESIPSGALKLAEECKRLLVRARNAAFDCGHWTDEDVDAPLYEPVLKASQDARTAALAAIDQLAALASPSPATGALMSEPLTRKQAIALWGNRSDGPSNGEIAAFARAVEAAHGIGDASQVEPEDKPHD